MLSNFFQIFLLVSPVFLLIILGNFLRRIKVPDISFWEINDKLCYWVLIPALLFHYISQINLSSEMLYSYSIIIYVGFGKVGQPFRLALSGNGKSGSIDISAQFVGKERTLARLEKAIDWINKL